MPTYEEFTASEDYSAALLARTKGCRNVERYMRRVKLLTDKSPNATAFEDLLSETKHAIKELDAKQYACLDLIADKCDDSLWGYQ